MKTNLHIAFFLFFSPLIVSGGFEDSMADFMSWVVLIALPLGGIYLFWMAHIYPEKVAEKNNHPQLEAIKTMCLLSLFVGGLLWPVALIWANYNYGDRKREAADGDIPGHPIAEETILAQAETEINELNTD